MEIRLALAIRNPPRESPSGDLVLADILRIPGPLRAIFRLAQAQSGEGESTELAELPEIADEPGMVERFQRGLRNLLNTPPQHRTKPKERPARKGRVHKGRTGR